MAHSHDEPVRVKPLDLRMADWGLRIELAIADWGFAD
jgi:hypothetical protein